MGRKIVYALGVLLLIIVCTLLLAPTLVSTQWGQRQLTALVNGRLDGHLAFQNLSLSWFSGQKVERLTYQDNRSQSTLRIKSLETDASLLQLLFQKTLGGRTTIDTLDASIKPLLLEVKDANGFIQMASGSPLRLHMKGNTLQQKKAGHFDVNIALDPRQMSNFNGGHAQLFEKAQQAQMEIKADLTNLPVALLDTLARMTDSEWDGTLTLLLGDTINAVIKQTSIPSGIALDIRANSPNMSGVLVGQIKKGQFILSQPGNIDLLVTPETFEMLSARAGIPPLLRLEKPMTVKTKIDELQMPLDKANLLRDLGVKGTVEIPQVNLAQMPFAGDLALSQLNISIDAPQDKQTIGVNIQGSALRNGTPLQIGLNTQIDRPRTMDELLKLLAKRLIEFTFKAGSSFGQVSGNARLDAAAQQLHIAFKGNSTLAQQGSQGAFNGNATIEQWNDLNALTLTLEVAADQFPAGEAIRLMNTDLGRKIEALFGSLLDARISAKLQNLKGPIRAELQGKNGSISLDGSLRNGTLTLNQTFKAQFQLSQELSQKILSPYIPLLGGIIGADNPLTITIDPQGFSLPLTAFDIRKLSIGNAMIDMGHIRFSRESQVASLLNVLNTDGNDKISVWFTPLYLTVQNGLIQVQRMDLLLLNAYPAATWGTVDLAKDAINMVIGLRGPALTKAFRLTGLSDEYMMQIPYKGKLKTAKIDKKAAAAKVSALVAQTQGPQGQLIGAFLEIAGGALNEEKAPPPTTNPLPWTLKETEAGVESAEDSSPLKVIESGAQELLKTIFR